MSRHIDDPARLPPFERVLSGVADARPADPSSGLLPVAAHKQDCLAALALPGGRFAVVSTVDEVHRPDWYRLVQAGKARGLVFAGHWTADAGVLASLRAGVAAAPAEPTADERRAEEAARDIEAMVADSSPLEWFRGIVSRCLHAGASDLHLELRGPVALARVRLDGRMRVLGRYPARHAMNGVSAAYTMLAEERSRTEVAFNGGVPQAAMIPLDLPGQRLTLRYQSHPAVGGMDVVIRLLRAAAPATGAQARDPRRTLASLGFTPWQASRLGEALASAWGGVFVAGVTGSGKTTTLNTMMGMLAAEGSRKLFTIEDPVEYETPGVSHLSIQRGASGGADPFHAAMLAFLRMDPDVGLFGEIRDALSASMAQAAIQTGHKILSTVHATSALGIVGRLSSRLLGLDRADLCDPEFLSALVYQVLMPLNCEQCKRPAVQVMSARALAVYETGFGLDPLTIHCASARGCPHCRRPGIDYGDADDGDEARNGTAGVKVGAEVIVPDLRLLDLLRQGRDAEARRHWRRRRATAFSDPDMDGKDAWGHVLHDVARGRVDPFHFERAFGSAALLAKTLADDED
ncbi:ATPase, T2SS/T4P/T4SS family [Mitsuaria sp. GD03876]|uniref:GspE/PulE family protein n=1 Tax=Mitsuaria sp. GD03876 TaxID=2975399 RepID=UPI00244AC015|nr:ATPase, T2SS/T4P/T4SS family [Mitsuaria sp. GD03876]MDH0867280.1 ATPase, T2SS/T4P/T4SS family [Mitsuaria sp. GD03876]